MQTTDIHNILNDYFSSDENDYSILLNGPWGVGKTYLVNDYFERNSLMLKNNKIINISLFGISNISDINIKIFSILHPIVGSKFARVGFNALKGALKIGVKLDLNSDGKDETSLNFDGKSLDFFGFEKK